MEIFIVKKNPCRLKQGSNGLSQELTDFGDNPTAESLPQ